MTDTASAGAPVVPAGGRRRRTDADLANSLLAAIHAHRGEWTTARACAHLNITDRHRARTALKTLTDAGHLNRHDRHGRRHYTLNLTPKDHA